VSNTSGLIGALLGYDQSNLFRNSIEAELRDFEEICKRGNWAGNAHLLRPKDDVEWCFADFPKSDAGRTVALNKPCGRPWRLHTVSREINRRVDRWNTTTIGERMSPVLKLWLAKTKYYKAPINSVDDVKKSLRLLLVAIAHSKSITPQNFDKALEIFLSMH
jgi:hypothetical protein